MPDAGQGISETQQILQLWEQVRWWGCVCVLFGGKMKGARHLLSSRKDCLSVCCGGSFLEVGGLLFMRTVNC